MFKWWRQRIYWLFAFENIRDFRAHLSRCIDEAVRSCSHSYITLYIPWRENGKDEKERDFWHKKKTKKQNEVHWFMVTHLLFIRIKEMLCLSWLFSNEKERLCCDFWGLTVFGQSWSDQPALRMIFWPHNDALGPVFVYTKNRAVWQVSSILSHNNNPTH